MILFLTGAIVMASTAIALFFLRFWRHTRDHLFLYFALAFVLESAHRLVLAWPSANLDGPHIYILRLLEYALIMWAIIRKNRKRPAEVPASPGSTMGLRKSPCMSVPDTPSTAPISFRFSSS